MVAVLQTFIDGKSTLLPVDGIPSQTNQFTRAQPGFQQQCILPVVVRILGYGKEALLFLDGKVANIVHCTDRLVIAHAIHRMFGDNIVHHSRFEHGTHSNVSLTDCRTGVSTFHAVQNDLAVHRLYVAHAHGSNQRLNISLIAFRIVADAVRGKVTDDVRDPVVKPVVYGHVRVAGNDAMTQFVFRIGKPILGFGQRLEIFFSPLPVFGIVSCGI